MLRSKGRFCAGLTSQFFLFWLFLERCLLRGGEGIFFALIFPEEKPGAFLQEKACTSYPRVIAHNRLTLAQQGLFGVSLVSFHYSAPKTSHRAAQSRVSFFQETSLPLPLKREGLALPQLPVSRFSNAEQPSAFL